MSFQVPTLFGQMPTQSQGLNLQPITDPNAPAITIASANNKDVVEKSLASECVTGEYVLKTRTGLELTEKSIIEQGQSLGERGIMAVPGVLRDISGTTSSSIAIAIRDYGFEFAGEPQANGEPARGDVATSLLFDDVIIGHQPSVGITRKRNGLGGQYDSTYGVTYVSIGMRESTYDSTVKLIQEAEAACGSNLVVEPKDNIIRSDGYCWFSINIPTSSATGGIQVSAVLPGPNGNEPATLGSIADVLKVMGHSLKGLALLSFRVNYSMMGGAYLRVPGTIGINILDFQLCDISQLNRPDRNRPLRGLSINRVASTSLVQAINQARARQSNPQQGPFGAPTIQPTSAPFVHPVMGQGQHMLQPHGVGMNQGSASQSQTATPAANINTLTDSGVGGSSVAPSTTS